MSSNESTGRVKVSGSSTLWTLQLIFLVLQVTDLIHWSWWLVFLPALTAAGLLILALVMVLISAVITSTEKQPTGLRGRQ